MFDIDDNTEGATGKFLCLFGKQDAAERGLGALPTSSASIN